MAAWGQPKPDAEDARQQMHHFHGQLLQLQQQLAHFQQWAAAAVAAGAAGSLPEQGLARDAIVAAMQLSVAGVAPGTTEAELAAFFDGLMAGHGAAVAPGRPVVSCQLLQGAAGRAGATAAVLQLRSAVEASNCLAFDGVPFKGAPLKVQRPPEYCPQTALLLGPCQPDPAVCAAVSYHAAAVAAAAHHQQQQQMLMSGATRRGGRGGGGGDELGGHAPGGFASARGPPLAPPPPPCGARVPAAPPPPPCQLGSGGGSARDLVLPGDQSKHDEVFIGGLPSHWKAQQVKELLAPYGPLKSLSVAMDAATGKNKGYAFVVFDSPGVVLRAIEELDCRVVEGKILAVQRATDGKPSGGGADGSGGGGGRPHGAPHHRQHHRSNSGGGGGPDAGGGAAPVAAAAAPAPGPPPAPAAVAHEAAQGPAAAAAAPPPPGKQYDVNELYIGDLPLSWDEDAVRRLLGRYGRIRYFTLRNGRDKNFAFCKFKDASVVDAAIQGLHGKIVDGYFLNVRRAIEGKQQQAPQPYSHNLQWQGKMGGGGGGRASSDAAGGRAAQLRPSDQQQAPQQPVGARLGGKERGGGGGGGERQHAPLGCGQLAPSFAAEEGGWLPPPPPPPPPKNQGGKGATAAAAAAAAGGAQQAAGPQDDTSASTSTAPSPPDTPTAPAKQQQQQLPSAGNEAGAPYGAAPPHAAHPYHGVPPGPPGGALHPVPSLFMPSAGWGHAGGEGGRRDPSGHHQEHHTLLQTWDMLSPWSLFSHPGQRVQW